MNDDIDKTYELLKRSSFEYTFKEIELVLGVLPPYTWKGMIEYFQSHIEELKPYLKSRIISRNPEIIAVIMKNGWNSFQEFEAEYHRRLQQILDAEE